jgi:hypothetical protein
LKCWLSNTPFDEGGIPSAYIPLLNSQRTIGWYQIFLARMSVDWGKRQSVFLALQDIPDDHFTGDKWTVAICTVIMTSWLELWDARNKDRHGADSSEKSLKLREQALREIDSLYSSKNKVLQRDQNIFSEDINVLKQKHTSYLRQWINTNQPIILKSIQDAKQLSLLHVRTMQTYFPPNPPCR